MTESERRARFERALAWGGNTHTVEDVAASIRDQRAQFWSNGDGMIVTEVERFPQFTAVRYWLIAGELRACLDLEPAIEGWARGEGCTVAMASGRRGWGRVAAPTGWRLHGYQFWKPLETVQ